MSDQQGDQAPDPEVRSTLDMWLHRQRQRWWHAHRRVVGVFAFLTLAVLLHALARTLVTRFVAVNLNHGQLMQLWLDSIAIREAIEDFLIVVIWLLAILMGSGLAWSYDLPGELSITQPRKLSYSVLRSWVRRAAYLFLCTGWVIPVLLIRVTEYLLFSLTLWGALSALINAGIAFASVAVISELIQLIRLNPRLFSHPHFRLLPIWVAAGLFMVKHYYYAAANSIWKPGSLEPAALVAVSTAPFFLISICAVLMARATRFESPD